LTLYNDLKSKSFIDEIAKKVEIYSNSMECIAEGHDHSCIRNLEKTFEQFMKVHNATMTAWRLLSEW